MCSSQYKCSESGSKARPDRIGTRSPSTASQQSGQAGTSSYLYPSRDYLPEGGLYSEWNERSITSNLYRGVRAAPACRGSRISDGLLGTRHPFEMEISPPTPSLTREVREKCGLALFRKVDSESIRVCGNAPSSWLSPLQCFVSGHDFSRAAQAPASIWASAPGHVFLRFARLLTKETICSSVNTKRGER